MEPAVAYDLDSSKKKSELSGIRKLLPYVVFGSCLLVYLYPFMRFLFVRTDEGTFLYGAVRVTEGQVPLRDFFETMGPGSFYWLALFFRLFGTSFFAARISIALTTLCTALLMYFLARRLKTGFDPLPAILLLVASFGPLWPAISHHNDSNLLALASFAALVSWVDTRRPVLLFVAGSLAGLTTCFMQPKGILLLVSLAAVAMLLRGKESLVTSLTWLAGGYFAVLVTVVALYWRAGALSELIYANVVWPLTRYSGVNVVPYGQGVRDFFWLSWTTALRPFLSPAILTILASVLLIPILFVVALPATCALFGLLYRRMAFDSSTLPYWVVGTALWLSEIHRKDVTHLVYGSPLLIILCLHLVARGRHRVASWAYQLICISTFVLAAFNGLVVFAANTPVSSQRGTFHSAQGEPVLDFLDARIQPGEAIFVYPYCPTYYFLSGASNPTRFSFLMYHMNTEAQFLQALGSLKEKKVRYVIWDHDFNRRTAKLGFPAYSEPPEAEQIIEPYLVQSYRVLKSFDGIDILERKPDPRRPEQVHGQ